MTNHRDDDDDDVRDAPPLDARLLEAARAHNAPPATPRDAMWERIAAARAAAPRSATEKDEQGATAVRVIELAPRSSRADGRGTRRPAWALPLAATILLGVGIGVGRLSVARDGTGSLPPATSPLATAPTAGESQSEAATQSPSPTGQLAAAPVGGVTSATRRAPGAESRVPSADSRAPSAESSSPSAPLAYRLAAAEHLASTETLLATISADAKAGRADSSVATWARDLLGTTRVLLDSPAARDPKMARLLEDLELVLAQVAQLPANRGGAEELQTIERAVRRRDVMTRVRAAIPTGPLSAGT